MERSLKIKKEKTEYGDTDLSFHSCLITEKRKQLNQSSSWIFNYGESNFKTTQFSEPKTWFIIMGQF